MKCENCGYEIDKPNRRTCPCCGQPIVIEQQKSEEFKLPLEEKPTEEEFGDSVTTPDEKEVEAEINSSSSTLPSSSMQECPRCQAVLSADDNFCPKCGYHIHQQEEDDTTEQTVIEQITQLEQEAFKPMPEIEHSQEQETPQQPVVVPPPLPDPTQDQKHKITTPQPPPVDSVQRVTPPELPIAQDESMDPYNGYDTAPIVDDGQGDYSSSSSFTWLVAVAACVVSILIGALLYCLF